MEKVGEGREGRGGSRTLGEVRESQRMFQKVRGHSRKSDKVREGQRD